MAESDDANEKLESIRNAATPFPNILTAGQPTEDQFEALAEEGFNTIVSTRVSGEPGYWDEASKAEELGIDFIEIPIRGEGDLTVENAKRLDRILEESDGKVCVHCGSSNRVGALFALRAAWLENKNADEALEIGRKTGLTRMEPMVRSILSNKD